MEDDDKTPADPTQGVDIACGPDNTVMMMGQVTSYLQEDLERTPLTVVHSSADYQPINAQEILRDLRDRRHSYVPSIEIPATDSPAIPNSNGDVFSPYMNQALGVPENMLRGSVDWVVSSNSSMGFRSVYLDAPFITDHPSLFGSFMATMRDDYEGSGRPWYPRNHTPGTPWRTDTRPASQAHVTHFQGEEPGQRWLCPAQGHWWHSYAPSGDMWSYQTVSSRCCYVLELLLSLEVLLKNPGATLHHTTAKKVRSREEAQDLLVLEAELAMSALEEGGEFCSPRIYPLVGEVLHTPRSPRISECLRPYWGRLKEVMGGTTQYLIRSVGTDPPAVFFGAETIIQIPFLDTVTKPLRRAFADAFPQKYWDDASLASWEPINISQLVEMLRDITYRKKGITPPEVLVLASWIVAKGWEAEYKELFGAVWDLLPLHGCVKQLLETG